MYIPCTWCKVPTRTIIQRSLRWRGEPPTTPLARLLVDSGLDLIEDWISCPHCGFNGEPAGDDETATNFVNALDREAGECTTRGEWSRARRRYVRMLAIFPDYSTALLRLGATFVDAPDADFTTARNILMYGDAAGTPRLPFFDYAIGKLDAVCGRADDARWRLRRYVDRLREPTRLSPFPDFPTDQTEDARNVLDALGSPRPERAVG